MLKIYRFHCKTIYILQSVLSVPEIKWLLWCHCWHSQRDIISLQCCVLLCNKYLAQGLESQGVFGSLGLLGISVHLFMCRWDTTKGKQLSQKSKTVKSYNQQVANKGHENKYDFTWHHCSSKSNCYHCCHVYWLGQCVSEPLWPCLWCKVKAGKGRAAWCNTDNVFTKCGLWRSNRFIKHHINNFQLEICTKILIIKWWDKEQ